MTIRTLRHEGPDGSWAWHRREPSPLLRPHVLSWAGFEERNVRVRLRRELPFPGVPLIITSEGMVGVERGADRSALDSFVAGPDDTFTTTDLGRQWAGVQVNLTPPAAAAVLGLPLSELARRTVRLDDLPGLAGESLVERVGAASTWTERFAVLERFLFDRLARGEGVARQVGHVWSMLIATKGRASVEGDPLRSRRGIGSPGPGPVVDGDRVSLRILRPGPPGEGLPGVRGVQPERVRNATAARGRRGRWWLRPRPSESLGGGRGDILPRPSRQETRHWHGSPQRTDTRRELSWAIPRSSRPFAIATPTPPSAS